MKLFEYDVSFLKWSKYFYLIIYLKKKNLHLYYIYYANNLF